MIKIENSKKSLKFSQKTRNFPGKKTLKDPKICRRRMGRPASSDRDISQKFFHRGGHFGYTPLHTSELNNSEIRVKILGPFLLI